MFMTSRNMSWNIKELNATSISETFNSFLNVYSRMTECCADFVCTLTLETSCEVCARI